MQGTYSLRASLRLEFNCHIKVFVLASVYYIVAAIEYTIYGSYTCLIFDTMSQFFLQVKDIAELENALGDKEEELAKLKEELTQAQKLNSQNQLAR